MSWWTWLVAPAVGLVAAVAWPVRDEAPSEHKLGSK